MLLGISPEPIFSPAKGKACRSSFSPQELGAFDLESEPSEDFGPLEQAQHADALAREQEPHDLQADSGGAGTFRRRETACRLAEKRQGRLCPTRCPFVGGLRSLLKPVVGPSEFGGLVAMQVTTKTGIMRPGSCNQVALFQGSN